MKIDNKINLSKLLKKYNIKRSMVSERIGVSIDTINSWCSFRNTIPIDRLSIITNILHNEYKIPYSDLSIFLLSYLKHHGLDNEIYDGLISSLTNNVNNIFHDSIYIIGSHLNTSAHQMIIIGLTSVLNNLGYHDVICLDTIGREERMKAYIQLALRDAKSGVVLISPNIGEYALNSVLDDSHNNDIRLVIIDIETNTIEKIKEKGNAYIVNIDNFGAADIATKFLLSRGHSRIACVGIDGIPNQVERMRGYRHAIQVHGGEPNILWALPNDTGPRPVAALDRLRLNELATSIANSEEITAVLSLSSHSAWPLVQSFHQSGCRIGYDKSLLVLGCWDWMHNISIPPITHVPLPYYEAGKKAAGILVHGDAAREHRIFSLLDPVSSIHFRHDGTVCEIQ